MADRRITWLTCEIRLFGFPIAALSHHVLLSDRIALPVFFFIRTPPIGAIEDCEWIPGNLVMLLWLAVKTFLPYER